MFKGLRYAEGLKLWLELFQMRWRDKNVGGKESLEVRCWVIWGMNLKDDDDETGRERGSGIGGRGLAVCGSLLVKAERVCCSWLGLSGAWESSGKVPGLEMDLCLLISLLPPSASIL